MRGRSKGRVAGWWLLGGVVSCAPSMPAGQGSTTAPVARLESKPVAAVVGDASRGAGLRVGELASGDVAAGHATGAVADAGATRTRTLAPGEAERLAFVRPLLAVPPGWEMHPCRVGSLAECEPLLVRAHPQSCGIETKAQLAAAAGLWRFGLACRRFGVGCDRIEYLFAMVGLSREALIAEVFGARASHADPAE